MSLQLIVQTLIHLQDRTGQMVYDIQLEDNNTPFSLSYGLALTSNF